MPLHAWREDGILRVMTLVRLAFACLVAAAPIVGAMTVEAQSRDQSKEQSQAQSQAGAELVRGVPVFETPKFAEQYTVIYQMIRAGALDQAAKRLDVMFQRFPDAPRLQIAKAEIAISRNDEETAVAALTEASSLGFAEMEKALAAPTFRKIVGDKRLQALLAATPPAKAESRFSPGLVKKGAGLITAENIRWNNELARLEVVFAQPPLQRSKPVSRLKDDIMAKLTRMVRRGRAAGNFGDVYDNRDGGHSRLGGLKDVQLTVAQYSEAAIEAGLHYGLNEGLVFDAITFGNSSTAITGKNWRSQPRQAMSTRLGAVRAWQLYDNNHVYVFPEHRDHDRAENKGRGDLFPANTPLMLISKGSSRSDKRFLQAIQIILAGLKPDVKALLKEKRLIAPAVQQIIRRGMAGIETEEDYLKPAAHPTVFDPKDVRLDRMLALANAMTAGAVPPRAQIAVTAEHQVLRPFASPLPEELFTTADATARMWRGGDRSRTYRLSAAGSFDANDRPLTYFWRVLSGDPAKVAIKRLKPDASEVEITIEWHEGIKNPAGLKSSRVDIGLFAHNGAEYSAPAMFSVMLPLHQGRVYSEDPSDQRPASIAYLPPNVVKIYADPLIWPRRDWKDVFDYDENGNLVGWTRTYLRRGTARFTRHGLKVMETDDLGRPAKAEALRYQIAEDEKGRTILEEQPVGRVFSYAYSGEASRLGLPVEVKAN